MRPSIALARPVMFQRFWPLTAYTPVSFELIPNRANKYLVASYTPGLEV